MVRLTDSPDMTMAVYRGRKTTTTQQQRFRLCQKQNDWYIRSCAHKHTRCYCPYTLPGRVAQSVGHQTRKSGVLGSIPSLATYFRFSFRFFKKGSCQLLAKVCTRSTG